MSKRLDKFKAFTKETKTCFNPGLRMLFLLIVCVVLLTSCVQIPKASSSKASDPASFTFSISSEAVPPDYFSAEQVDLSLNIEGGYGMPVSIVENVGTLAVLHRFSPEDGETYAKHYVATYDVQGNQRTMSELTGELNEKIITGIRSGADGSLLILEPWVSETKVYRYSVPEQKVTGTVTLKIPEGYVNTENLYSDTKGQFYLTADGAGGTKVFIYDADGKLLNSEYREGVNGAAFQLDDTFYFEASVDSGRKRILYPVNIQSAEFLDIVDVSEVFGNESVYSGPDYLCSMNSKGLYWFDPASREKQTMISWEESDFDQRLLSKRLDVAVLSKDTIFLMIENESFEKEFYLMNRQRTNPNAGKKTLVLAAVGYDDNYILQTAIQAFNENSSEYKIEYKDYYPWSEIDFSSLTVEEIDSARKEADRQVYLDVLSGDGPDIIYEPTRTVKESGLLLDLMPLMESDDNFCFEDYLPNLVNASMKGDSLYSFPISFSLEGLAGQTSFIGDIEGWTIDEFDQMVQTLPEDMVPITYYTRSDLLESALSVQNAGFYDSDAPEDCIDEKEFVSLLKWAKKYGVPDDMTREEVEAISNDLFSNSKVVLTIQDISIPMLLYDMNMALAPGASFTFVGFPSPSALGVSAITQDCAITQCCEEPLAAWAFIKVMLSEDIQTEVIKTGYGIPIRLLSIDLLVDITLSPNDYSNFYYFGNESEGYSDPAFEKVADEYYREIGIPTFEKLVYSFDAIKEPDEELIEIVLEEASAYFNDMKTAEEVVEVIQNRAQMLFNERAR